jgi:hypothetical protein
MTINANQNVNFKAQQQGFVACPPSDVYKYSVYKELDLGRDTFSEIAAALKETKPLPTKSQKFKKAVKNIVLIGIAGFIAYKKRDFIKKLFKR